MFVHVKIFSFVLLLLSSVCQAFPLPEQVPKTDPNVVEKIVSTLEKTQTWNVLKGWYKKAREWLMGEDGVIGTFYLSTGDPPKSRPSPIVLAEFTAATVGNIAAICAAVTKIPLISDSVPPPPYDDPQVIVSYGNNDSGGGDGCDCSGLFGEEK